MNKLLLERLLAAGVSQEEAESIVAAVAADRRDAERAARQAGEESAYEAQELDHMVEEYDRMYGDYAEEEAGVTCFGMGTVYKNDDGEPTGWC